MDRVAYGEVVAPEQVDTLRDEECPICGSDSDSFDGDQCRECGFVLPPSFVRDPDLGAAKRLDLRQQQEPTVPEITPEEAGPGGPMPGVVDPGQVAEDGSVPEEATEDEQTGPDAIDPDQIPEDDEAELDEGAELPPEEQPDVDPEAATDRFNQGGESFTPGPNDPEEPGEPEGPEGDLEDPDAVSPEDIDADGEVAEEAPVADEGQPDAAPPPGTPGDETPDLVCPNCGFEAPAARPTSTDMDDPLSPDAEGDGMLAGDACPSCGQATLLPVGDLEEMQTEAPAEEGMEPEDDAEGAPEEDPVEDEAPEPVEEDAEEPEEDDDWPPKDKKA